MNKRYRLTILFLFAGTIFITAQDINPMLTAFQKSFARGSISTKIQVLQDSSKITDKSMGPLYLQALQFIIDNNKTLYDDPTARELTVLTIRLTGLHHYSETAASLWKLFGETADDGVKVEILSALGEMEPPDNIVQDMNNWLKEENKKVRSGVTVNAKLLSEAVVSLGNIGHSSSFNVVFSTGALKYSAEITEEAAAALKKLGTDYAGALIDVVNNNLPSEKLLAVKLAESDPDLDNEQKGKIFQAALEKGLGKEPVGKSDEQYLRKLRFEAVKQLTALHWTAAASLAIENFNRTSEEVDSGRVSASQLVESINFLGSVNTHEAALRLSMYLEVLNSHKERGQQINTQVVMAVIKSLGVLGDKTAFDNLLYAGYLDYPASVKKAAREALNNLKTE